MMITRREFLARGGALAFAWSPLARLRDHSIAPAVLRLVYLDDGAIDARDGITLGVEEARHAAALFGGAVEIIPVPTMRAVDGALRSTPGALLGGRTPEAVRALAQRASAAHIIYMNTLVSDDALRIQCSATTFHVAPSDAMGRDARRLAHAGEAAPVVGWDPSLERFGADTLNERFKTRFGRPMTLEAWTNWFAVKALWESSLRARATDAKALAAYLASDAAQFDGHKGRPLSFRSWDHQLRQPVYVRVAPSAPLVEEPAQAEDEDARTSLDRIGVTAAHPTCGSSQSKDGQ